MWMENLRTKRKEKLLKINKRWYHKYTDKLPRLDFLSFIFILLLLFILFDHFYSKI